MEDLRILQLATSTGGGAGIAARRVHESLLELKLDSSMMTLTNISNSPKTIEISRSKYEKILRSTLTFTQSKLLQYSDQLVTPVSKDAFFGSTKFAKPFSVVHIHAYYNLVNTNSIVKLCKTFPNKRFFITLHDERLLTGGCHYSNKCTLITRGCKDCPQATKLGKWFIKKDYENKLKNFKHLDNLELITPSEWLRELANKSELFSGIPVHMVRNPIPEHFFKISGEKVFPKPVKIVFISANLNTRMKGLQTLIEAVNLLASSGHADDFELVLVGSGPLNKQFDPRLNIKTMVSHSDFETSQILSECQILVIPSIQDNLPSTMIEAICAGLSVIGSRTGGIPEILRSYNQEIFEVGDSKKLSEKILALINQPKTPSNEKARMEFSYQSVAATLLEIYLKN